MKKKWRYKPMATPVPAKHKKRKPMATKVGLVRSITRGWLRSASAVCGGEL
jgi:hypothetical protein